MIAKTAKKEVKKEKKDKEGKEEVKVIPQLRIKIRSYDSKIIDKSCQQIVEMAERAGVKITGPVPLPTEIRRYTVARSPFIHKDSREQFEMRVHKRLIEILNSNQRFIDFLRELVLPTGVEIEIKTI